MSLPVKSIGILGGTGQVGKVMAAGFVKAGYDVMVGTRDATNPKVAEWLKENPKVKTGTNEEAAKFGDVVLISAGWEGTEGAIKQAGPANLKGKVLLDITNPIVPDGTKKPMRVEIIKGVNGGKTIQGWAPEAHVVKFLNSVGNANFCFPFEKSGVKPTTFIAGNDKDAKATTSKILNSLGWEHIIDAGDIESATYVEALCPLWVNAAFAYPELQFGHNWSLFTK